MKKALLGILAVLISAFVLIMVVNAQDKPQETKKCATTASCAKDSHAAPCCSMKYGSTATAQSCCNSEKSQKGCDKSDCKAENCSPENCKSACPRNSQAKK